METETDISEFARKLFAGTCDFLAGATSADIFPKGKLPEIAFVGRSNVGKSSLINALTGRTSLARVSHTPGRTRQVNFFDLGHKCVLVDLPGYGYAKASKTLTAEWQELIVAYLRGRAHLQRVILLVDSRRGVMDIDADVMAMLDRLAVSYLVVLTKIDKVPSRERDGVMEGVRARLAGRIAAYPQILATSADAKLGLAPLKEHIAALAVS